MRFRDAPIRFKLVSISAVAAAAGLVIAAVLLTAYAARTELAAIERNVESVAQVLAINTTAALTFNDATSARETLSAVRANPSIQAACLYELSPGQRGQLFASFGEARDDCAEQPPTTAGGTRQGTRSLTVVTFVTLDGNQIGTLSLQASLAPVWQQLTGQTLILLLVLVGSLLATVFLVSRLQRVISKPIVDLARVARGVRDTRDYTQRASKQADDEIGGLVDDFNAMLARIEKAAGETATANTELEHTLGQLKKTQTQLVQTEKLSSLGGLVAGIAHEINTPVGISVTAASFLQAQSRELKRTYSEGGLKKSMLESFVNSSEESTQMILSNLHRASDLIQSFKQVAVDQSSAERRVFDLSEYVDEVMLSLRPALKKTQHTVDIQIPLGIQMDSFPGAFAQILTNLVNNAVLHAFPDDKPGVITIEAAAGTIADGDTPGVTLRFADDGCGIPPDNIDKVFDPFFTTRRGQGGSGLGMHIVYNLVTQALAGTISVDSTVGQGTQFTLQLPLTAPRSKT